MYKKKSPYWNLTQKESISPLQIPKPCMSISSEVDSLIMSFSCCSKAKSFRRKQQLSYFHAMSSADKVLIYFFARIFNLCSLLCRSWNLITFEDYDTLSHHSIIRVLLWFYHHILKYLKILQFIGYNTCTWFNEYYLKTTSTSR